MPATPTYVALAEVTLAATATSVTLPVPTGYRDLVLVMSGGQTSSGNVSLQFNGDTGSNYSRVVMYGDGSSTGSFAESSQISVGIAYWENAQHQLIVQLQDVSATDKHKTVLSRSGAAIYVHAFAGRWANTTAITSIVVKSAGSFNVGTTLNLYGIEA